MPLYTKSSQLPRSEEDGVRICIMRRPKEGEVDYDIWMPRLAPTHEMLTARHQGTMEKPEFNILFAAMLETEIQSLEMIIVLAKRWAITLLCVEEEPQACHRYLVAQKCQELAPDLEVVIK